MTNFSAILHGANMRPGFDCLIEVFHPRDGVASQYVEGRNNGEGRVYFDVERNCGVVTYSIPDRLVGRTYPFPLATHPAVGSLDQLLA